jgi:hypothetical protein
MKYSWKKIVKKDFKIKLFLQYVFLIKFSARCELHIREKNREKKITCSREKFDKTTLHVRDKNSWKKFIKDIVVHFILYKYLQCYLFNQYF